MVDIYPDLACGAIDADDSVDCGRDKKAVIMVGIIGTAVGLVLGIIHRTTDKSPGSSIGLRRFDALEIGLLD